MHVPYAISANNGVPTGTIMPFIGTKDDVPDGWLLCDGVTLVPVDSPLYKLIKATYSTSVYKTPDLRGRYLKGVGQDFTNEVEPINLGRYQKMSTQTKDHTHSDDLSVDWNNALNGSTRKVPASSSWRDVTNRDGETSGTLMGLPRRESGETLLGVDTNHKHSMSGSVKGITTIDNSEVRPSSFGVNYIIKL